MANSRTKVNKNDKWGRSVAETDRRQFRFDIGDMTDEQKREVLKWILAMEIPMNCWRYNSKAIWLNEDQEAVATQIKLYMAQ